METKIRKIVLAYSGGLDTSIMIPWLRENYGNPEIIAVAANVGQGGELIDLEQRALATGATKYYEVDLREEFARDYIFEGLKLGAKYENVYLLGTAFARPVIAKALVKIATQENADAIAHGCTGKGNDQVRFELGFKAFLPDAKVIAPWREWELKSRDDEIDYAEARGIKLTVSRETNYSKDKNLWHLSHEGLDLENPANAPKLDDILELAVTPENAPDTPTYVTLHFERGVPTALNDKELSPANLIKALNKVGGENGIGIVDMVENRLVGMKSRGVYETPGGAVLYKAAELLRTITLDKETQHFMDHVGIKFGEIVYNGQWFTPLREALSSFAATANENVCGDVKLKLYKGNVEPAGVTSSKSLYSEQIASFDTDDSFTHSDAAGFINLFGLPIKVRAELLEKLEVTER
ncbi:MAG: argininosuccinate synthase [Bifidobacteriaceae bacterium]|nr:argininosuccinate synthase [Bifidobacteriaceae bacterium]